MYELASENSMVPKETRLSFRTPPSADELSADSPLVASAGRAVAVVAVALYIWVVGFWQAGVGHGLLQSLLLSG